MERVMPDGTHRMLEIIPGDAQKLPVYGRLSITGPIYGFSVCEMPALLTSTSRRPSSFQMRSAAAAMEA
jgi:hypothetical protein